MKNVKEIEIKLEGKEWEDLLNKAFNNKKKDLKVDGFRKGSCPKDIYIKKFGIESLYMDAVDLAVNEAYHKVLEANELKPVCEPKVDITHICEKDVTFKFTIIERPEIKLGKYKNLGVKKETAKVTAEEIEHEIEHLKERFADVVELTEGKVEKGNTAIINFEGYVDGKKLEGGTGENYPLEIGSNTFIPGFEEGLIGMNVNDEKTLKLKFPEDYVDELKGKAVEFKVKVTGLKKRILPELSEEFYKDLGYENVKTQAEFKKEVKEHLLHHKEEDIENKYIDDLLKKACDNLTVEINSEIIDDEIERMLNQYRDQLKMQGLTLEQYFEFTKMDVDTFKKNLEPQATNNIKARYLLEEIANKEKAEVTDKEVSTELDKMAEMYQVSKDELIQMIGSEDMIRHDLMMRKAIDVLKETK